MATVKQPVRGAPPPPYNLFKTRTANDVAVFGHYESVYPVTGIDARNSGPITFAIPGTDTFIDFNKIYLSIKGHFIGKAKDSNQKVIDINDANFPEFGPTNLLPHSMIQTVNVNVCNKSVALGDQHYPYRAYIQYLLNNNKDALDTIGVTEGWCKDSGDWDAFDHTKNPALKTRKELGNDKHEYSYTMRLCTPLLQHSEVFLPECNIEIQILKNPNPQFYIMHDPSATMDFIITEAVLHVRKTKTTDQYRLGVEKILSDNIPLEIILGDPRIFTKSLSAGESYLHLDYATFGNLPRRLILGMVDTLAFNGKCDLNPFNFQHFNISKVSLFKNGLPYPTQPVMVDFKKRDFTEGYRHLLASLQSDNSPFTPDISLKDFENGVTLFSFDMTPDQYGSDEPLNVANRSANIKVSLEFAEPLKKHVTLIVYYDLEMLMTIDSKRNVLVQTI